MLQAVALNALKRLQNAPKQKYWGGEGVDEVVNALVKILREEKKVI